MPSNFLLGVGREPDTLERHPRGSGDPVASASKPPVNRKITCRIKGWIPAFAGMSECQSRAYARANPSLQQQRRLFDGVAGAHRRAYRDRVTEGSLGGGRLGLATDH